METPQIAETALAGEPISDADSELDAELLEDPRALTILTTEHWGLLSARGLAYNESFTRANMYLAFISMSFIALGLFAQATNFNAEFLGIAALVLGVDFVIGVLTQVRMMLAALEDSRAVQGMNRIRNGYVRIAPTVERFLTTATHDDAQGMLKTASLGGRSTLPGLGYSLSTSGAMVGLITNIVGGALVATIALNLGVSVGIAALIGAVAAVVIFVATTLMGIGYVRRELASFESRFPTPSETSSTDSA